MSFFLMDRGVDSTCFFLTLCSLTRHTRKSTSVTNDINDVAIPFELTSGPCQRASMHFSRALTLGRLSGNTAMLNGISHTCVWHVRVFTMGKALDCNIMKNISHLHICYSMFQLVYFHYDGLLYPMSGDKDCCFSLSLLFWFFYTGLSYKLYVKDCKTCFLDFLQFLPCMLNSQNNLTHNNTSPYFPYCPCSMDIQSFTHLIDH